MLLFEQSRKPPSKGKRQQQAHSTPSKVRTENLETLLLPMTFINPLLYYFCDG